MTREHAVIFEQNLRIPTDVFTFAGFQDWVDSDDFPETGRIDFLAGDVEVEVSPEDLYTHAVVKTAIAARLSNLIVDEDRGEVYIDRTRVVSPKAGLSVEPDVVAVLWESFTKLFGTADTWPSSPTEKGGSSLQGSEVLSVCSVIQRGSDMSLRARAPAVASTR